MTTLATPPGAAPPAAAPGFQRRLGPFDATMLVAGSMIGSGIFIVSADIARDVGSAGGLLAVWLVTGLMTVIGALSYAELAAMMPHAGGQYVYLREAYGPFWGFLYGWTLFLVIQTGTIAAVGVAFTKFLGVLAPSWGMGPEAVLYRVGGFHAKLDLPLPWLQQPLTVFERTEFTVTAGQLVGAGLVLFLTWVNCRGVQAGKVVQNVFTVTKTLALAGLIVVGLTVAASADVIRDNLANFWGGETPTKAVVEKAALTGAGPLLALLMVAGGAMVGSLFSSDSWNNVTFTAGEVRNPRRTLPLSLVLGTGLVTGLYLLANVAYVCVLPVNGDAAFAEQLEEQAKEKRAAAVAASARSGWLSAEADSLDAQAAVLKSNNQEAIAAKRRAEAEQLRRESAESADLAAKLRRAARDAGEDPEAVRRLGISHARDDRVGTAVLVKVSGRVGVAVMAVAIMVSTFGCLNGLILAGARLYWAMARDGLFFRSAGDLNARGVPAVGLVLQGVWAVLLVFSGTYGDLLDYVIFAALLFYAITVAGLFVLRRTRPDTERPYRALGYPLVPLLYVVLCCVLMVDLLIVRPKYTWPGLLLVLTGVPVYFLWRAFGQRPAAGEMVTQDA
jgi:amino acid transporter